jgi:hypothetical protein
MAMEMAVTGVEQVQVQQEVAIVRCSACEGPFAKDDMVRIGAYHYCVDCLEKRTILTGRSGIVIELIG